MSDENQINQNQNQILNEGTKEISDFDKWINETPEFVRLPKVDNESIVVQFFKDKSKREIVTRVFEDKRTGEKSPPTVRAKYKVLLPNAMDQGEKSLEAPKTLARQIEENLNEGKCLQKIIKHTIGNQTRYSVVALG
jgi:hypothetical protein